MRNTNLILLLVVAAAIAFVTSTRPRGAPSKKSTPAESVVTASGTRLFVPEYELAGLSIGQSSEEVQAFLGKPDEIVAQNWRYRRDGATLALTFLEGRLIAIGGSGRWMFEGPDGSLPGWMSPASKVRESFGEPTRKDGQRLVYSVEGGELTFAIKDQLTDEIWLVGQLSQSAKTAP